MLGTILKLCELHEKAGHPVDKNAIFREAVGRVDKKKRVYGVGSSKIIFCRPTIISCIYQCRKLKIAGRTKSGESNSKNS